MGWDLRSSAKIIYIFVAGYLADWHIYETMASIAIAMPMLESRNQLMIIYLWLQQHTPVDWL